MPIIPIPAHLPLVFPLFFGLLGLIIRLLLTPGTPNNQQPDGGDVYLE